MRHLILVNRPEAWPLLPRPDVEVVSAKSYLTNPSFAAIKGAKVVNLDDSYAYQSVGYYASLLASARGHKVIPSVSAIQDLRSRATLRLVNERLEGMLKKQLANRAEDRFVLESYFGRARDERYAKLGKALFGQLQMPLLRATFHRRKGEWRLKAASPIAPSDLDETGRALVVDMAINFFTKGAPRPRMDHHRYDVAILVNPKEGTPPSNAQALARFAKAGEGLGLGVDLIERDDFGRLAEYDALFIRETTAVDHHTYRFARRAASEGLVVIDDPDSILRCTNKVFLAELLQRLNLPHPRTQVIEKTIVDRAAGELGYPCILKTPDGAFSRGVVRVGDRMSFIEAANRMLENSELILAQEYIPTEFDWRIGVLGKLPIFACKYFMARGHWQIYNHGQKKMTEGDHACVPLPQVPKPVLDVAVAAASAIGDGLYGVDLKEIDGKPQIIEVNDNPNIDAGVEDQVLGAALYERVMRYLLDRIMMRKVRS
jgi:glutathione synthase/RimK-type ligase-like ATP-grasp enzyme